MWQDDAGRATLEAWLRALACLASRPAVLFVETERALAHHVELSRYYGAPLLNLTASVGAYMRDVLHDVHVPWKARVWPFSRARGRRASESESESERGRRASEMTTATN